MDSHQIKTSMLRVAAAQIDPTEADIAENLGKHMHYIELARQRFPDVNVLVHPECVMETVQAADLVGSTEFIRNQINNAPAGSVWAVGTEISLVNRLAINNPDKTVFCLDPVTCPCSTMYRIHPAYVLWVMESLLEGRVMNEITVTEDIRRDALVALNRMLQLR